MYDMTNLTKLSQLAEFVPDAFRAFQQFDAAAFADGAISLKYKELIAVGVALATQCPYCIDIHSKRAVEAGATARELSETALVAAAIRAGGAITHATHALP